MSRKVKFRFWDIASNEYCSLGTADWIGDVGVNDILNSKKFITEQYTGLTDINGVDVYEGDIVRVNYRYDVDVGEVKFLPEQTCFVWYPVGLVGVDEPGVVSYRHLRDGAYGVEVVGNVHSLRNKNIIDEEFL